ncbi:hypothetical protein P3S68_032683 [Capsicum galapagoense]
MDDNECNNQLRAKLHNVFDLEDSDSLHGNEDSYGGYVEGPDRYLDTDDEDLQNLADEEMNRCRQSVEDKDLSVSYGEEDDYGEDDVEEEEGPMHDDSYTEEQYAAGPVEEKCKKLAGQLKYVTFGCHKCRKITARNQSKRVDCKARKIEQDGEEESRSARIAGLRPSKSIRLLEVEAGGPERMRSTPKFCRNYILQQWRLRTLSSDAAALHKFFVDMQSKDEIFFIQ